MTMSGNFLSPKRLTRGPYTRPRNMDFLTPSIHTRTSLPDGSGGNIKVDVCSEFAEYPFKSSILNVNAKIFVVKDALGQPIVITKDANQQLVAYAHTRGGPAEWQRFALTSSDTIQGTIGDYDIKQIPNGDPVDGKHVNGAVLVTFCTRQPYGRLYHATWEVPIIAWDENTRKIRVADTISLQPTFMHVDAPEIDIDVVSISQSVSDQWGLTYTIMVGTAEYNGKAGSHYQFDPNSTQFTFFPLAGVAQAVFQIQAASLTDGPGAFALFRHLGSTSGSDNGPIGLRFDQVGANFHYALEIGKLGDIKKLRRHLNTLGQTDLFVACDAGLAFFPCQHMSEMPELLFDGIDGFRDVVTSENPVDAKVSKIVVFALSHSSDLYYLEGTRDLETTEVMFMRTTSWEAVPNGTSVHDHALTHPIRRNVSQISTQYNAQTKASELIFIGNGQDEVVHLWKDDQQMWHEQNILISKDLNVDGKAHKFPSYITTVSVKDAKGNGMPHYPCTLASQYSFVLVNDRSFTLDDKPMHLETDASGKLTVVRRITGHLTGPQYRLSLEPMQTGSPPVTFVIEPAHRVLRGLSKIKKDKDISEAKDTRGRKVFAEHESHDYDTAARVVKDVPSMLYKVDAHTTSQILGPPPNDPPKDVTHAWEKNEHGVVRVLDGNDEFVQLLNKAEEIIESGLHVLGEIFEALRAGFKAVVKFAIKYYYGPLVRFYIRIGTKVLHFVLEHIGPVIRSIASFLDDVLGTNLTKFVDWLGFIFDPERTRRTQKVLVDATKNALTTAKTFARVNNEWVKNELDQIQTLMKRYIKDTRPIMPKIEDVCKQSPLTTVFDFLFDNPILGILWRYTPVAIIMEAAEEEFSDLLQAPDISAFTDIVIGVLSNLVKSEVDVFVKLFADIVTKLGETLTNPLDLDKIVEELSGDLIWTIFDAVKPLLLAIMDSLESMCDGIVSILEGKWVIPGISENWTEFTGTECTIIDVVTFLVAEVLNLYILSVGDGKELFHDDPNVAQRFLIDEKYLNLGTAMKRGGLDLNVSATGVSTLSSAPMHRNAVRQPPEMMMLFATDPPPPKQAAKKWNMIFSVCGRCIGTFTTLFEIAHTIADLKETSEAVEMAENPGSRPAGQAQRLGNFGSKYRNATGKVLKFTKLSIEKIEQVLTIGGNALSVFASLGSVISITVFIGRTTMSTDMPQSGYYLCLQWVAWCFRLVSIPVQLGARQVPNNDWQAVPPAIVNAIGILLASGAAELAIEYRGETQEERDDPQSKKMVAAASTEIAGSIIGVVSSCLAGSFKTSEQPEVGVVMLITQALDFSCSVSGIGCVSSVIEQTGMQDA